LSIPLRKRPVFSAGLGAPDDELFCTGAPVWRLRGTEYYDSYLFDFIVIQYFSIFLELLLLIGFHFLIILTTTKGM